MSTHFEGLGRAWSMFFDNPQQQTPAVVAQVLDQGGTRESWQTRTDKETMVIAWPQESALRFGVTIQGDVDQQLRPVSTYPLLEGLPNDMTVEDVYPWKNGTEGTVAACCNEGANPVWFYTPFLFRDQAALTPGVRHTFVLSGLAYGVRRALLDSMTITEGAQYEQYAQEWLSTHPGASQAEVPQLTIPLAGSRILSPDSTYGEYQLRVPVTSVEPCVLGNDTAYMLIVEFGLNTPCPLRFPLYATERACNKYVPQAGDEIDAIFWMQGRIAD